MGDGWVVVGPAGGVVEVWSSRRLPFEPKGAMVELRGAIRAAVAELSRAAGYRYRLAATYRSLAPGLVDAENILFYNVGTGAFGRPVAIHGERRFEDPPPPLDQAPGPYAHHHRYVANGVDTPTPWRVVQTACRWSAPLPNGAGDLSGVARTWRAIRQVMEQCGVVPDREPFAVRATIAGPGAVGLALLSSLKTVLDGIVAACHHHDGTDAFELASRIAEAGQMSMAEVQTLLSEARSSPLGERRLVHRFGKGVQWNPADDLLVMFDLEAIDAPSWTLSGELLTLDKSEGRSG